MLCCFDIPSHYSPVDTSEESRYNHNNAKKGPSSSIANFPGRRAGTNSNLNNSQHAYPHSANQYGCQYGKTNGNALASFDPSKHEALSTNRNGPLVSVTIPEGTYAGQVIHVSCPNNSGRLIAATVPVGLGPGSTFMVQFPPFQNSPELSGQEQNKSQFLNTNRVIVPSECQNHAKGLSTETTILALPSPDRSIPTTQAPNHSSNYSIESNNDENSTPLTKFVHVRIPPGTQSGTTIHVAIPGEDRVVAATVPPGDISEFQVAYEPLPTPKFPSMPVVSSSPIVSQSPHPFSSTTQTLQQNINQTQMILVNVPPGATPGTTIHVPIPGTYDQYIAATVPSGRVSQFYVSFTPASSTNINKNSLNAASTNPSHHNPKSNTFNNHHNNNGSGMGTAGMIAAPLVIGAAALAGMSMMHHDNQYTDYNDDSNEYERYGDLNLDNVDKGYNDGDTNLGMDNVDFGGGDDFGGDF